MRSSHTSIHVDTLETFRVVRAERGGNHVAVYIEDERGGGAVSIVLPLRNGHFDNAAWLRRLAGQLTGLAAHCDQLGHVEVLGRKLRGEPCSVS